jgi:hypothetical protein
MEGYKMETTISRRTFLRNAGRLAIVTTLLTQGGCSDRKEEYGSQKYRYKQDILDNSAELVQTSVCFRYAPFRGIKQNSSTIDYFDYTINFKKPGEYHFEFWGPQYRTIDQRVGEFTFKVDNPEERSFTVTPFHHRIAATACIDGKLKTEDIILSPYGNRPLGELVEE